MAKLERLALFNSGRVESVEIPLGGDIALIGATSSGKTSILRALYLCLVMNKRYLGISREQRDPEKYYFQDEKYCDLTNSYVVYSYRNDLGGPMTLVLHREDAVLKSEFIPLEYDRSWFVAEDKTVLAWPEVRARLGAVKITQVRGVKALNNVMLGCTRDREHSILNIPNGGDFFQALLSCLFTTENDVHQGDLRRALIYASLSSSGDLTESSMDESMDGVAIGEFKNSLKGFEERYSDIRLLKDYKAGVDSPFAKVIDKVFKLMSECEELEAKERSLPGSYLAAVEQSERIVAETRALIAKNEVSYTEECLKFEKAEAVASAHLDAVREDGRKVEAEFVSLQDCLKKYDASVLPKGFPGFEEFSKWFAGRSMILERMKSLAASKLVLESGIGSVKTVYEGEKNAVENEYGQRRKDIETRYKDVIDKVKVGVAQKASDLEKEIKSKAMDRLRECFGLEVVEEFGRRADVLSEAAVKAGAYSFLSGKGGDLGLQAGILDVLTDAVLDGRNAEALEEARVGAREGVVDYALEQREVIDSIREGLFEYEKQINVVRKRFKVVNDWLVERRDALLKEVDDGKKRELDIVEMRYKEQARKHGVADKRAALKKVEDESRQLDLQYRLMEKYPNFVEEYRLMGRREFIEEANAHYAERLDRASKAVKAAEKAEAEFKRKHEEWVRSMNQDIQNREKVIANCRERISKHEDVSTLFEVSSKKNEKGVVYESPVVYLDDFFDVGARLMSVKESFMDSVRELYTPNLVTKVVLSDLDTFDLGIEAARRKGEYSIFRQVADNLWCRLYSNGSDCVDSFVEVYSEKIIHVMTSVMRSYNQVSEVLRQINKLRVRMQGFFNEHNRTDCVSDLEIIINTEATKYGLLRSMEKVAEFYKDKGSQIGADNLFSDDEVIRGAFELMSKFNVEMERYMSDHDRGVYFYTDMFEIELKFRENGHPVRLLGLERFGSNGTNSLFLAQLNMALIASSGRMRGDTRLFCPVDEVGKLSAENFNALKDFASAAGFYLLVTGQSFPRHVLSYEFQLEKVRHENGIDYGRVQQRSERVVLREEGEGHE